MNIESAVYLLTQMRDEIDPSMFDPDAKAIDTVLRRLAALERVAAAAEEASNVIPGSRYECWRLRKALAALRESEGGKE